MAASASAAQANQRASTRRMCSARRAASLAWAAAYATAVWSANWLEWTTRKRISALSRRPVSVFHFHLADDTGPVPASRRLLAGAARFFEQERQRPMLLAPRLDLLAHRTRPRH